VTPPLNRVTDVGRTQRVLEPDRWWHVEEVTEHGTRLYYRLGPPRPVREASGFRRDARGRVALEAFLGLPISEMYQRLDEQRLRGEWTGNPESSVEREAFGPLVDFTRVFGPLGLEWQRIHVVDNPDADRLARQNAGLRALSLALAPRPEPGFDSAIEGTSWRVVLAKPGTLGIGRVEPIVTYPGLSWTDRAASRDDLLHHDELGPASGGPLVWAHSALTGAAHLADALARADMDAIEGHLRESVLWIPSRVAASGMPRPIEDGIPRSDGSPADESWLHRGRWALAQLITHEMASTLVGVEVEVDRFIPGWRIGSLVDLMYLQLLEHLQRHPDFGIGDCHYCGMPILRVRRSQRYHSGCGPAGRQRESRAARRAQLARGTD
jgi:hypothetical protein